MFSLWNNYITRFFSKTLLKTQSCVPQLKGIENYDNTVAPMALVRFWLCVERGNSILHRAVAHPSQSSGTSIQATQS